MCRLCLGCSLGVCLHLGRVLDVPWLYFGCMLAMAWLCLGYRCLVHGVVVSCLCFGSVRCEWVVYGLCLDCVSVVSRLLLSCVLVASWLCLDCALVVSWLCLGYVLVVSWLRLGRVLVVCSCVYQRHFWSQKNFDWARAGLILNLSIRGPNSDIV